MLRVVHRVHTSSDFGKSFRRLPSHIQELAIRKDLLFRENAFAPSLRTHKLKGPLEGYWAYSVNREYRVLFRFLSVHEVIYYDIGTHAVYRQ